MSFWKKTKLASGEDAPSPKEPMRCSFCNKVQDDVFKLIAGPSVNICDGCVAVCVDVLANEERPSEDSVQVADGDETRPHFTSCSLCLTPMVAEEGLPIAERGMLCAGCAQAVQVALAERQVDCREDRETP